MWNEQGQMMTTNPGDLVAAVFLKEVSARDAIADLKIAGFSARQIGVALSKQAKPDANRSVPCDLHGKHSVWWKLRHSVEHDLHSHGADLSSKEDEKTAHEEGTPYTPLVLSDALGALGVLPATIDLMEREVGANGTLVLVDAGSRANEVESILVQNRGILRTVMATEQAKMTS
jgi:hypothetical protein